MEFPHTGFGTTQPDPDEWYEDRDEDGKRYGHRSEEDSASDLGSGDQYYRYPESHNYADPWCGSLYKGRDTMQRPSDRTFIYEYTFKLVVVDICSEDADAPVVAESGEETIRWYRDSFPPIKPDTERQEE